MLKALIFLINGLYSCKKKMRQFFENTFIGCSDVGAYLPSHVPLFFDALHPLKFCDNLPSRRFNLNWLTSSITHVKKYHTIAILSLINPKMGSDY